MSKVCAISIYVTDLDQAAEFYASVLGMGVKEKMPYIVQLNHEGVDVVLCQGEKPAAGEYSKSSSVVLGFVTPNLDESIKTMRAKKVKLVHEQPQDFPVGRYVAFQDPSGNVHELLEFSK